MLDSSGVWNLDVKLIWAGAFHLLAGISGFLGTWIYVGWFDLIWEILEVMQRVCPKGVVNWKKVHLSFGQSFPFAQPWCSCWQGPDHWRCLQWCRLGRRCGRALKQVDGGRFTTTAASKLWIPKNSRGTTSFPFLDGFSMKFSLIINIHYINHPAINHYNHPLYKPSSYWAFPITKPNPHFYAVETHTFPVIPMPCWGWADAGMSLLSGCRLWPLRRRFFG